MAEIRSIPYKQLLRGVANLAGVDFAELTKEQTSLFIELIYERTKEVWEMYNWPDVCRIEERAFAGGFAIADWEEAQTRAGESVGLSGRIQWPAGTVLYFRGENLPFIADGEYGYYRFKSNYSWPATDPGGFDPFDPAANILEAVDLTRMLLPVTQVFPSIAIGRKLSLRDLGTVIGIFAENPAESCRPRQIPFDIYEGTGFDLGCVNVDTVWVHFRERPNRFNGSIWDEDVSIYGPFTQVYHPFTGEFWRAGIGGETLEPGFGGTWTKLPYPAIFETFVKRSVYADYLRTQGAFTEASVQRHSAERHINDEIIKLAGTQRQVSRAIPSPRRPRSYRGQR